MTPVGHASLSYLVGQTRGLSWPAVMAGGLLVDIDFVLLPLPAFNTLHRTLTHNLVFVLCLTALGCLLARHSRRRIAASVFIGGIVHLGADAILDSNPSNGIGIALLWPLSGEFFSPINLLAALPTTGNWDHIGVALWNQRWAVLVEMPLFVLALTVGLWRNGVLPSALERVSHHIAGGGLRGNPSAKHAARTRYH